MNPEEEMEQHYKDLQTALGAQTVMYAALETLSEAKLTELVEHIKDSGVVFVRLPDNAIEDHKGELLEAFWETFPTLRPAVAEFNDIFHVENAAGLWGCQGSGMINSYVNFLVNFFGDTPRAERFVPEAFGRANIKFLEKYPIVAVVLFKCLKKLYKSRNPMMICQDTVKVKSGRTNMTLPHSDVYINVERVQGAVTEDDGRLLFLVPNWTSPAATAALAGLGYVHGVNFAKIKDERIIEICKENAIAPKKGVWLSIWTGGVPHFEGFAGANIGELFCAPTMKTPRNCQTVRLYIGAMVNPHNTETTEKLAILQQNIMVAPDAYAISKTRIKKTNTKKTQYLKRQHSEQIDLFLAKKAREADAVVEADNREDMLNGIPQLAKHLMGLQQPLDTLPEAFRWI